MLMSKSCSCDSDIWYSGLLVAKNSNYLMNCCTLLNGIWSSIVCDPLWIVSSKYL